MKRSLPFSLSLKGELKDEASFEFDKWLRKFQLFKFPSGRAAQKSIGRRIKYLLPGLFTLS